MKRIILITTLLFASLVSLAQARECRLLYSNTDGENGISFFEYDGTSRLFKGRWQLTDTSRWSTNYYLYNELGQLVEQYREFSDGLTSSLRFEYDSEGKPKAEIFSRPDGRKGTTTFAYDGKGFLKSADCHKYYGWIDGTMKFICDSTGLKKSAFLYRNDTLLASVTFRYDGAGKPFYEYWDFNGQWNQVFMRESENPGPSFTSSNVFIPESNRYRLCGEFYSYNNQISGQSFFFYDENGRLVSKEYVRSDSLKTVTQYEYNSDGILLKSFRVYGQGKKDTYSYTFNRNRQLKSRIFEGSDGSKGIEEYEYDAAGYLSGAKWVNFDKWLTGSLRFEYNRARQISKGFFTAVSGDNAILSFRYDENGNLKEIHWVFDSGLSQVYRFTYRLAD